jgi:hypothetical protein
MKPEQRYPVHVKLVGAGAKVDIFPDGKQDALHRVYTTEEEVPEWIREKVAILRLAEMTPHMALVEVAGVGVRLIDDQTFWIAYDTRETSQNPGSEAT